MNIPSTQSTISYFLLTVFYNVVFSIYHKTIFPWNQKRNVDWWKFLFLAFADVEATFLVVTAYGYTNLSSIILLTSFSTPCTMILSWIILKKKYRWNHFLGVFICLFGTGFLVVFEYIFSEKSKNSSWEIIIGNLLVIISSFLYSTSNLGCEYVMRNEDSHIQNSLEYFSSFTFFAFFINALQTIILESKQIIYKTEWSIIMIVYLLSYAICLFATLSLIPHFVNYTSATFFNLSLLTQNVYSLFIDLFILKKIPGWYYYPSFFLITIGIIIYNSLPEIQTLKNDPSEEKSLKVEQMEKPQDPNEIQNTNENNL